ncbi:MAG: hypothetical protein IJU52_09180 [Clostridia bacterium]|nr:hypothetical protein [Clostridia bacterium]
MPQKNSNDLTAEELLRKLRENFGEDAPTTGTQMTIEETAAIQNKRKVYRYKKEKPVVDEEEEREDDEVSARLARSIENAERIVGAMHFKDDEDGAEDADGAEEVPEEAPEEAAGAPFDPAPEEAFDASTAEAVGETDGETVNEAGDADGQTPSDGGAVRFTGAVVGDFAEEQPVEEEPVGKEPVEEEPVEEEPTEEEPAEEEPVEEEPVEEEPVEEEPDEEEPVEEEPVGENAVEEDLAEEEPDGEKEPEDETFDDLAGVTFRTAGAPRAGDGESGEYGDHGEYGENAEGSAFAEEDGFFESVLDGIEVPERTAAEEPDGDESEETLSCADEEHGEGLVTLPERSGKNEITEDGAETDGAPVEEAISGEAISEEAISEEAISEEAISEEAISEEAISEEAASEETASEETASEEKSGLSVDEEDEAQLMMIFGMNKDLEKKFGKEKAKELRGKIDRPEEQPKDEYESPGQNEKIFAEFRRAYRALNIRTVLALIALALTFVFEALPALVPGGTQAVFPRAVAMFLSNPVYAALVNMQWTLILAAIGYKEFFSGVRSIGSGRSTPEILLSLTVVLHLIYEGGMIYCHSVNAQYYNLPVALCVCLALFFAKTELKRNLLSFKIVSSKKTKYVVTPLDGDAMTLEKEAFGDAAGQGAGVYGVKRTKFVSGFAARSAKEPKYMGATGIFATVIVVIALVFFLLGFYFSKETTAKLRIMAAFNLSILAALFCMPVSALITFCLPFYKAARKAYDMDSAIIGGKSLEEYADATVISFEDKDIFPSENVRVRSLKLYGDSRIDHVLFGVASLFKKLGGPLEEVFAVATKESGVTGDVDLLEIDRDGVEAAVKGVNVYVGSSAFMRRRNLLTGVSEEDEALELEGKIRIMYVAIGRELSAKMYIEYIPDKEFRGVMASLYRSGMCVGVRTLDPNIDDRMMQRHVDLSKYPVKILRREKVDDEGVSERVNAGIVSKRGAKGLLKSLSFCRRVLQVVRAETVLKVVSIVLGAALAVLILVMTGIGKLNGAYAVGSFWTTLYQLCFTALAALIALMF